MSDPRRPRAFVLDDAQAPPIDFDLPPPAPDEPVPLPPVLAMAPSRGTAWGLLLLLSLVALIALGAVVSLVSMIVGLFAASSILGIAAAAIAAIAVISLLALIGRELRGFYALERLEHVQEDARRALSTEDQPAATRALQGLARLFARRPDMSWALARLEDHARGVVYPADRIRLAERDLMIPLDQVASGIIARSARSVTVLTAVTPAPALDMLFVVFQNLKMLRQLAELYGVRAGSLGTLKLARMVLAHLAVAGGLALSDSVLQHVLGKGLVGRLSARFGEGAVNGILTARIGLAALDICRPLPFVATRRPALAEYLREIVKFDTDGA